LDIYAVAKNGLIWFEDILKPSMCATPPENTQYLSLLVILSFMVVSVWIEEKRCGHKVNLLIPKFSSVPTVAHSGST
jgi:hypothetical protein